MMKNLLALGLFLLAAGIARAQTSILDVGARVQHSIHLYTENGVSASYSPKNLKHDQLYLGLHYVTSRLGTAWGTNAIKQDNFLASASWVFRKNKTVRPFGRVNTGLFVADYGDKMFDDLPQSCPILSTEAGVSIKLFRQMKLSTSAGLNLITGDGMSGPGTLYPVFYQFTVSWNVLKQLSPQPKN